MQERLNSQSQFIAKNASELGYVKPQIDEAEITNIDDSGREHHVAP